jgi:starch synthase (maltosyl-transferring)
VALNLPSEGRARVVVEKVRPEVDGGRFPVRRVCGERVEVEADVFADGHDSLVSRLMFRRDGSSAWSETPMEPLGNDRWRASFEASELGQYFYTVEGWVDHFLTWRKDLAKRIDAGESGSIDLLAGALLVDEAADRATVGDAVALRNWAALLRAGSGKSEEHKTGLDPGLADLVALYPDRRFACRYERELTVVVERTRALAGAWYEMFPRSCAVEPGRHGTFADCEARLPYVERMGFDVLYLPPIHPIGHAHRKGRNNSVTAAPGDTGSPWAIGSEVGGHTAIEPALGTLADFERLIESARGHGLEVAMDLAYQCTPDHPWVREHPEWFRKRPDGTIQYAENPPKKYQDICPIDFETAHWRSLWEELRSVVLYWLDKGVRIFRVDNPHTKAFAFWEWMIGTVRREYPDVVFLAEAFTRPKVMYRLAKLGFSQSYTYFTWRNNKEELTAYMKELASTEVSEYFRPSLWPNTPDILPEYLQAGGRPAFMIRVALAATLGATYGIYGPAFELCENEPVRPGSEEYLNSEKYEIRQRDLDSPWSLRDYIARINRIRKENPALLENSNLRFHEIDNPSLICYSKTCYSKATLGLSNVILVVVNLDCYHTQSGWTALDTSLLGVDPESAFQVHDLLADSRYVWNGSRNYVELNPAQGPAHIFRLRQRIRTEHDFDYFL